jgi:hypothetical protein
MQSKELKKYIKAMYQKEKQLFFAGDVATFLANATV